MGYSTQSKGYKIWDTESSKLVVSRDVIIDEYSVNPPEVDIQPNAITDSNVADPGGEPARTMDSNIELSSDSLEDSENTKNEQGENGFINAQGSPAQELSPPKQLRRSSKGRKQTGE